MEEKSVKYHRRHSAVNRVYHSNTDEYHRPSAYKHVWRAINQVGGLAVYSVIYWFFSLVVTWALYLTFKSKPEFLFFTLIIAGIIIIIAEVFIWGAYGSAPHA